MKDFYSTEDSLPSVNKNDLKIDRYEAGNSLREKNLQQSNLQKLQFYNNIQFPKKEEIKCQINNRSKRILSFSCPSEDTYDLQEKQNTQQNNFNQCNKPSFNISDQQSKNLKQNIIYEKSHTENTVSRKYKLQLKDKISEQLNAHSKQKSFVKQNQSQKVSLDIYQNPEDEVHLKKNQSIQIENSDLNIINNKKERVLFPNFDKISPLEYRGISSSLNSSIIQKQYSKGRDKFSLRSEIQQIGNMFVYKSELSSSKLPYLRDSIHDQDNNGLRNSLIALSKSTLQQVQKNNRTTSITRQPTFDQEQSFCNSQKQINCAMQNDTDQLKIIQKKLNYSDRKLAVLKVLKNKIKNRQNSLPATQLMIINSKNQYNEHQENINQNNSQIFPTQYEQQNEEKREKNLQSSLEYLENSQIEDKNQLSRLLMKQQPLRLHEYRNQSQIIFQQVSPTKNQEENDCPQKYQRKRIKTQCSKQNMLQSLEKQIDNKSLLIKKSSIDSQFIYPIITQRPSQQNTKQNSPFKKESLSPITYLKNNYDKEEEILKSCQQYIARLFKRREHNLKKKSAQRNMDNEVTDKSNQQLKQKKMKQDKILNDLHSLEKTYEDNFNQDFEQLQKYYDQKYLQNNHADNFKGVNEQKCQSPKNKDKSPEKNKLQLTQSIQNEDFLYQNVKKIKSKKKPIYQNDEQGATQNFQDLKPWNDLEQNKTSLSFFHKTIFDPDQEKNIRNSQKLY
ncbi:hypothetical protein TTHERM_00239180 (macronuclear) [Tetrahymena thermophila SB210]|uniref:Uncharacterized protein n=1 Tax=Tetrahymena thermophila (strain SB210) TaxID=312017 RepID=I7MIN2_TETTS|nr:hypothetical protein TTHERM_00239180 [Tetrahymena thermophila SB210]EAS04597.1 hypothetical protein TTHERM_00239180 [Tetrahymena thermophila SB210]|eukprot:XP_001024842.1 hypothetical protein TTHERM_00239180 [Tetrahymena thermophila SB210]